jgi:hypothetical protein
MSSPQLNFLKRFAFPLCSFAILGVVFTLSQQRYAPRGNPSSPKAEPEIVAQTPAIAAASSSIGTNLAGIADWSTALPFVDIFRSSRPWVIKDGVAQLDDNGWVKSLSSGARAETIMNILADGISYPYPGGRYLVLYEGEGTLSYGLDAVKDINASRPGREVIQVTPRHAIQLFLSATNPQNYLRNIRIIPLAAEKTYQSQPFNPQYLERLKPFQSLRFMDWMETNNSKQKEWAQRPTLNSATWQALGAPVEIMVQLANQTGKDPWFCMPHQATDEYVRNFATYVRDHLDPRLQVYVEYSNEVWNYGFGQAGWVLQQGKATWPNTFQSDYERQIQWFSRRTTQIVQIWEQVFGDRRQKVIGVMAWQAAGVWGAQQALKYSWSSAKPESERSAHRFYGIDAVAIAPYFGYSLGDIKNESTLNQWAREGEGGIEKIFRELNLGGLLPQTYKGGALQESRDWIAAYQKLTQAQGLELLAYEGGQHLAVSPVLHNNTQIVNLFIEANRDFRMGIAYRQHLKDWRQLGGGLFMHYNDISVSSKFGSWGALEHVRQPTSAKYDALLQVIRGQP